MLPAPSHALHRLACALQDQCLADLRRLLAALRFCCAALTAAVTVDSPAASRRWLVAGACAHFVCPTIPRLHQNLAVLTSREGVLTVRCIAGVAWRVDADVAVGAVRRWVAVLLGGAGCKRKRRSLPPAVHCGQGLNLYHFAEVSNNFDHSLRRMYFTNV